MITISLRRIAILASSILQMKNKIKMMEKQFLSTAVILILLSVFGNSVLAGDSEAKIKSEIADTLKVWNTATKTANLEQTMVLFDDSEEIMLVGSAEASKGKDQIRTRLGQLYGFAGFSWEMTRVNIDNYGTTAWVFMEGKMIVDFIRKAKKSHLNGFLEFWSRKGRPEMRVFDGSVAEEE